MKTTKMLTILVLALGLILCLAGVSKAPPIPMGTAFTYQGHLYDNNDVANGLYDFQFTLWGDPCDPCDANQVGTDVNKPDVDVIDGYFTVELDFGEVFNGDARWLEIGVRPGDQNDPNAYPPLSPRQEVTPVPYALQTRGMFVDNAGNVGIGTTNPLSKLSVGGDGAANTGVYSEGSTYGVEGVDSDTGSYGRLGYDDKGVYGSGSTYGVHGSGVAGVYGSGTTYGVFGKDSDTGSYGRLGYDTWGGYFSGDGYFSGNVGIGTDTPTTELDVVGTVKATAFVGDGSGLTNLPVTPDADSDPANELNTSIVLNGNNLELTDNGGTLTTSLSGLVNDADSDPSNELNTSLVLNGNNLELTDNGGTLTTSLSGLVNDGDWTISGTNMYPGAGVTGNVGIGTTNPLSKLSVGGDGAANTGVYGEGSTYGVEGVDSSSGSYGRLGYDNYGVYGRGDGYGVFGFCSDDDSGTNYGVYANAGSTGDNDAYGVRSLVRRNGSGTYYSGYFNDVGSGGTYNGLYADIRIGGAIDLAEYIVDSKGDTEAGDVLAADPDNDESVIKSSIPYDSTVVGIVSTQPHLLMGMELVMDAETGERYEDVDAAQLSLAGRVPVKVTDENGPIQRGDMLTTSSKPGYAMKWSLLDVGQAEDFEELKSMLAENERRRNAVVGKALGNLDSGDGKIVALVNLQ